METPATKVCTKCHTAQSLDEFHIQNKAKGRRQSHCKACVKKHHASYYLANRAAKLAWQKQWRLDHPEENKKALKAWYKANREEALKKMAQYRDEHREAINAQKREHYAANRERLREEGKRRYAANALAHRLKARLYRLQNKDKIRLAINLWNKKNPGMKLAAAARRRAAKALAPVNDFSNAQFEEIKIAQKHQCYYCGRRCKLTRDHITPLSNNGSHTLHNIIGVCRTCNSTKSRGKPPVPVQPFLLTLAKSTPYVPKDPKLS